MTDDPVQHQLDAGVLTITLNRPHRLNAWTADMERGFMATMVEAARSPDVRVIVLTGAGRGFCSGADVEFLNQLRDGDAAIAERAPLEIAGPDCLQPLFQSPFAFPAAIPKPVIAAVNGPAVGIGLALALFCDIRIASESAVFVAPFARMGLVSELGLDWLLNHLIGPANAMEMLLSARKVPGVEAVRLGLATSVHPDDQFRAVIADYAGTIAKTISPRSAATIKRQVQAFRFKDYETLRRDGQTEMHNSLQGQDFQEYMASMREMRAPAFEGLSVVAKV